MQITVIGTGYVGLVTAACLAANDNEVICIDNDDRKITALQSGQVPFYEPGLENLLRQCIQKGNITFSDRHSDTSFSSEIYFIAVGTPQSEDGSVNMEYVFEATRHIGAGCKKDALVINKSTMAIGSSSEVQKIIDSEIILRKAKIKVNVVANPEFLREGSAIQDFTHPDRIIVGSKDEKAICKLKLLYAPFLSNEEGNFISMDPLSAELTKYAANAMLATRISFMNEIAHLASQVNADIESIKHGIGSDKRIGSSFLNPGIGYGGSCFPKDISALIYSANEVGVQMKLLSSVQERNEQQKKFFLSILENKFQPLGGLKNKKIALWGLSYKPETDDIRDAPSIDLINGLINQGVEISVYDPVAKDNMKNIFPESNSISYCKSAKECLLSAQALIVCTEWDEFKQYNFQQDDCKTLRFILDGRNCLNKDMISSKGLEYIGIGR